MLSVYRNMFRIPDLRNKILFTLAIFAVYRLGAAIPVPGVDLANVQRLAEQTEQQGGVLGLLNLFSGGALESFSVFALGIMPYITASIMMQLLAVVIPRMQKLQEEGEAGRRVVTQWTRYVTVGLALLQSTGLVFLFAQGGLTGGIPLITDYTPGRVALIVLTLTAGTAFIMWLGELITQRGVGNGMSLLIFISIISQLPSQLGIAYQAAGIVFFTLLIAMFLAMVVAIIFVEQGQRRIPIQFAKRVRGRRVLGGQSTYIPLKVNTAGVIPIIFASSILYFPALVATSIPTDNPLLAGIRSFVDNQLTRPDSYVYIAAFGLLVVFFTYFYTAIQFDPVRQSEMIQRQGGFIPGIRPGASTSRHLEHILTRITLPGSLWLASVAVIPSIVLAVTGIPFQFAGISILITVGVALETMKQIESQLLMRNYEGFLA
ncbi:MAG: preprotein translocase subunit SecY [Actinomycetota bacterium]|nr:preprotein translocase subunit SecY [Actinomycetota bacterium]